MWKNLGQMLVETCPDTPHTSPDVRVLFLGPGLDGGGAERVMRAWNRGLGGAGCECLVVATDQSAVSTTPGAVSVSGGALFGTKALAVRRYVRRFRPNVVFSAMPAWNLLAILLARSLRGRRPRVVISLHTIAAISRRDLPFRQRVVQAVAGRLYRLADACVAVSPAVAAEAVSSFRVRPERLWVVPNPVLGARLPEGVEVRPKAPDGVTLVLPARLVPHKRPHALLEVADLLQREGIGADVLFIGDGPLRSALEREARNRGITATFSGWTDPWQTVVPSNSVLVLPSVVEGFGNVLVEAASVGIPSVVNARALGVSAALVAGVTGIVVDDNSPQSLASGVCAAMQLSVPHLGEWLAQFQQESVTDHLLRMLRHVCNL